MSRVAIYAPEGGDLIRCARQAQRTGERVVTMASEEGPGTAGRRLDSLVERMRMGEFDSVLAPLSILGALSD